MSLLSHSIIHETVSQNGKIIKNLDAETVSDKDDYHMDFITKGNVNGTPFVITNVKGILQKNKRRSNKKRKSVRFRTPTPHPKKKSRKTQSRKK
jgi:hypothetical protein